MLQIILIEKKFLKSDFIAKFVFSRQPLNRTMTPETESLYLKKFSQGSHDAFRALFDGYFPRVRLFILRMVKIEDVAEELAQDVFVKVWLTREDFRTVRSFGPYVFSMARNQVYNYYKHKKVEEKFAASVGERHQSPSDEEFDAEELARLVERTVGQMPPQRKAVYEMSRQENLSNDEIAARLNLSKRTVENHLYMALKSIKEIILIFLLFFSPLH